jgi:hypothetical protein
MPRLVDRQAVLLVDDQEFHGVFRRAKGSAHSAAQEFVTSRMGVQVPREAARIRFTASGSGPTLDLIKYKPAQKHVSAVLGSRFELPMTPCYSCGFRPEWLYDEQVFDKLDVISECDPRYDKLPGYSCPQKQGFMPRALGKFEIVLTYVPPGKKRADTTAQVWQVHVREASEEPSDEPSDAVVIQRGQVVFRVKRAPRIKPPREIPERELTTEFGFGFQGLVVGLEDKRCRTGPGCLERGNLPGDLSLFVAIYFLGTLVSRVIELRDNDNQTGRRVLAAVSGSRESGHQVIHLAGSGVRALANKGEFEFQIEFEISLV